MNEQQMREWIDNASYEQLFSHWRFAPVGDPFFQGAVGEYYAAEMGKRRKEVGGAKHTEISKSLGWQEGEEK